MIKYDPSDWARHLFTFRGSVLVKIMGRIMVISAFALGVLLWHQNQPFSSLPATPHALVGLALGLLLVFRTNSAYDRFWEGRKRWGMIVNRSRDLSRQVLAWMEVPTPRRERVVRHIAAYAVTTKRHLRSEKDLDELEGFLPDADLEAIRAAQHRPLKVAEVITSELVLARREGGLSDYAAMTLDGNLTRLIDDLGACERILKTPIPFAYVMHLRRFLFVFLLTLPFVLVEMGWAMVASVAVITYALIGIEEIGVQIEDPFGHDLNDLPIDEICETIQANLMELLDRSKG